MQSLAKTVQTLEARRAALAGELAAVDARLLTIARAVDFDATSSPGAAPAAIRPRLEKSRRERRSWFARHEAVGLLRKLAKSPKAPAELVRDVSRLKGYDGKLSAEEAKRFQGAAYMAIAHALKAKALRRGPKGQLVAA